MVGIYPRQSIEKKDSLSIEQQIQRCVDLCNANGWEYKVYDKDKGYSGKNLNRPSFEELMRDMHAGRINKILCYKLDRISRNISDFSNLLVDLQKHNCEFISISENFDTSSPIGRAMIYICMVFAQMERENTAQRVHDNYYYRTKLGFWGGGVAPYGYKLKRVSFNGKMHTVLDIDENTSDIVRLVYDEYLRPGGSVNTVLHKLNIELKIPSRQGKVWTSRIIADILTRPLYAPNNMDMYNYLRSIGACITDPPMLFDGTQSIDLYGVRDDVFQKHKRSRNIENMYCNISYHPAVIDSDTWISVQHKRKQRVNVPPRTGTGKNSVFTGLMVCGCCGLKMSWTSSKGTEGYYICSSKKNRGWNSCPSPIVPKKQYDPIVLESISKHYSGSKTKARVEAAKPKKKSPDTRERNLLLARLAEVENQIDKLITTLTESSEVTAKYIDERIALLDKEKTEINLSLVDLDASAYEQEEALASIEKIALMIDDVPGIIKRRDFDETKELVHLLVKKITFSGDKDVDIEYTV